MTYIILLIYYSIGNILLFLLVYTLHIFKRRSASTHKTTWSSVRTTVAGVAMISFFLFGHHWLSAGHVFVSQKIGKFRGRVLLYMWCKAKQKINNRWALKQAQVKTKNKGKRCISFCKSY